MLIFFDEFEAIAPKRGIIIIIINIIIIIINIIIIVIVIIIIIFSRCNEVYGPGVCKMWQACLISAVQEGSQWDQPQQCHWLLLISGVRGRGR